MKLYIPKVKYCPVIVGYRFVAVVVEDTGGGGRVGYFCWGVLAHFRVGIKLGLCNFIKYGKLAYGSLLEVRDRQMEGIVLWGSP